MLTFSEFTCPRIGIASATRPPGPRPGHPRMLRAHDDRNRSTKIGVGQLGLGPRGGDRQPQALQSRPGEHLGGGGRGDRDGEHGPLAGPDGVRVGPVRDRIGGDHGIDPSGISGSQHRAEVARLLDPFADEDERVGGERHVGQRREGSSATASQPSGDSRYETFSNADRENGPRRRRPSDLLEREPGGIRLQVRTDVQLA